MIGVRIGGGREDPDAVFNNKKKVYSKTTRENRKRGLAGYPKTL